MGTKHSQNITSPKLDKISRNHFEFLYVVGKGGFGKVWKVTSKKYKKSFALKEMSKVKIIDRKSEKSILYERELLSKLKNPFIVNMIYCFQDYDNLYLVMDLLNGGDLRYHISRYKKFTEEQTKFFVGCIILGLEYIHNNKVIHRDIKPENLVLDEKGYLRITDFGVGKIFQKENSSETSGTPGYMAPEVMCAQNHSYPVDYFAVGVIAFEFMYGIRPYLGKSRKEIKELILAKQVQIKKQDIPSNWSVEAADLINKLLQRKVSNRIGTNGILEIKEHPWFENFSWDNLYSKRLPSPFIPKIGDNFDKKYCEGIDKIGNDTYERYQVYYKNENFQDVFRNYTFNNISETKEEIGFKTPTKNIGPHLKSHFSANNLLSKKVKISDSLYVNKGASGSLKSINNYSPDKTVKLKIKGSLISTNQFNMNSKSNSTIKYQSVMPHDTPFKFNNEKITDQLPFIDANKKSKSIVSNKQKIIHSNSSNKLTNSSSTNSIVKSISKFRTISSNSITGQMSSSGVNNMIHKRTGSSNYFQY